MRLDDLYKKYPIDEEEIKVTYDILGKGTEATEAVCDIAFIFDVKPSYIATLISDMNKRLLRKKNEED